MGFISLNENILILVRFVALKSFLEEKNSVFCSILNLFPEKFLKCALLAYKLIVLR